jgi:hypothetical protein
LHSFRDKVAKKRCANMDPYVTVVVDEETFLRKKRYVLYIVQEYGVKKKLIIKNVDKLVLLLPKKCTFIDTKYRTQLKVYSN